MNITLLIILSSMDVLLILFVYLIRIYWSLFQDFFLITTHKIKRYTKKYVIREPRYKTLSCEIWICQTKVWKVQNPYNMHCFKYKNRNIHFVQGQIQTPQHFSIPVKFFSASRMSEWMTSMSSSMRSSCSTRENHTDVEQRLL